METITAETKLTQKSYSFVDTHYGYRQEYNLYVDGIKTNIVSIVIGSKNPPSNERTFLVGNGEYKTAKQAFEADGYEYKRE